MTRHVGIVACSSEGAALCYRTICSEAAAAMGEHAHPEVSLHGHSLAEYNRRYRAGDWEGVAQLMRSSAEKLAAAGADFFICPDNTIHQALEHVTPHSPRPWIHIAEVVASEARARGYRRLGITGTEALTTGPVYPSALEPLGIELELPGPDDRKRVDHLIFAELVKGMFSDASRAYLNQVFARLRERGCDAVVMGCTEIPILMEDIDTPLPTLDSTRLLARAAVRRATESD